MEQINFENGLKGRRIPLENLPNTRDLGGMETTDGRHIIPGKLLRSGALADAAQADKQILLRNYHLKTVVDFRTELERNEMPDPQWEGVTNIFHPVTSEEVMGITREKGGFAGLLEIGDKAEAVMMRLYPNLVCNEFSRKQYAEFLRMVLRQEDGAILWHCSAGKDRAGMGTALLLFAFGVPETVIREDYMRTNTYLKEDNERLLHMLAQAYGADQAQLNGVRVIFETREVFFESAVNAIRSEYGDMETYFKRGLGLTEDELNGLRAKYLI